MAEKLKVGIVGLGGICKAQHMPAYEKMEEIEVAAICDIVPEKIEIYKKCIICLICRPLQTIGIFWKLKDWITWISVRPTICIP